MGDLGISVKERIGTDETIGKSFNVVALMDGDSIVYKIPMANNIPLSKVEGVQLKYKK